jgi:hypothetical protein
MAQMLEVVASVPNQQFSLCEIGSVGADNEWEAAQQQ